MGNGSTTWFDERSVSGFDMGFEVHQRTSAGLGCLGAVLVAFEPGVASYLHVGLGLHGVLVVIEPGIGSGLDVGFDGHGGSFSC